MATKKMGRPTVFTPELQIEILNEISEGSTQRACFRKDGRPTWRAWCAWKRDNPDFLPRLAQADRDWCEFHEAELQRIALDESNDVRECVETIDSPNGITTKRKTTTDNTSVQRHKLQIETISRLMKWKMPERYGDKVQNEHSGSISVVPVIELATKETK
jgi:hypothetical protein